MHSFDAAAGTSLRVPRIRLVWLARDTSPYPRLRHSGAMPDLPACGRRSGVRMRVLVRVAGAEFTIERAGLRWAGAVAFVAAVARALELDRRVADAVLLAEHRRDAIQNRRALARWQVRDDDVAGEGGHATGDGPDVQIVDIAHAGDGADVAQQRGHRDVLGGGLQQDVRRLGDETHGANSDEQRDQHAHERVHPARAGQQNGDGAQDDGTRGAEVADDVEQRRAGVQALAAVAMQSEAYIAVGGNSDGGRADHDARLDRLRRGEAPNRLEGDAKRDQHERGAVGERREDADAMVAEGAPCVGG